MNIYYSVPDFPSKHHNQNYFTLFLTFFWFNDFDEVSSSGGNDDAEDAEDAADNADDDAAFPGVFLHLGDGADSSEDDAGSGEGVQTPDDSWRSCGAR